MRSYFCCSSRHTVVASARAGRASGNVVTCICRSVAAAWASCPSACTASARASRASSSRSVSPARTRCPCSTGIRMTTPVTWLLTETRNGVSTCPLATNVCTRSARSTGVTVTRGPSSKGRATPHTTATRPMAAATSQPQRGRRGTRRGRTLVTRPDTASASAPGRLSADGAVSAVRGTAADAGAEPGGLTAYPVPAATNQPEAWRPFASARSREPATAESDRSR